MKLYKKILSLSGESKPLIFSGTILIANSPLMKDLLDLCDSVQSIDDFSKKYFAFPLESADKTLSHTMGEHIGFLYFKLQHMLEHINLSIAIDDLGVFFKPFVEFIDKSSDDSDVLILSFKNGVMDSLVGYSESEITSKTNMLMSFLKKY